MYRLEYKAYRRRFASAFSNAREDFPGREGILLRVEDCDGRVGFGESAPIPSFGSETFASSLAAVTGLGDRLPGGEVADQLRSWPALRWGLESALEVLTAEGELPLLEQPWPVCGLAADLGDLKQVERLLRQHYRCIKFKIGKRAFLEERRDLDRIVDLADGAVSLRLDANGCLDARSASQWLESVAEVPVEFLEQPLPLGSEREMMRLADDFPTPLALDESVCRVDDLKRWRDEQWPGVFVLKPSLSGSLRELREELGRGPCDCVYSSALETAVGARSALALALEFPCRGRALGFGVDLLFGDSAFSLPLGPFLQRDVLPGLEQLQALWNRI